MDVAGLVAGVMLGAGVAAQAGFWVGRRRSAVERAVVEAAVQLRDASENLELTLEDESDTVLFENVAADWNALEDALDDLEAASGTVQVDFT